MRQYANSMAGKREWCGLAVLVLPTLLISMDMTALFFALPTLSAELEPSSAQLLWIMDIYAFLLAGSMITLGTLGDRIGRRRMLVIGGVAFGVASVLAAYSTSAEMLIASRAALGLAGATLAPSTLSLIRSMFLDDRQRRTAIAVWTAGFSGGAGLGPLLGGVLLEHFWWGSVFLINVPVMVLLVVLAPLLLPEFKASDPGRFDLVSAALSLAAVLPVVFGLKLVAEDGPAVLPVLAALFGLAMAAIFVRRQRRLPDPLIDVRLFAGRAFSTAVLANVFSIFALVGFGFFGTQYLQLVLGMRPLTAGLWTLLIAPAMVLSVTAGTMLVRRVRPGYVVAGAIGVMAAGFATLTQVYVHDSLPAVGVGFILLVGGSGAVGALAVDMIVAAAPPESAGAASALSETGSEFGGAMGVAVLGSIGAAVYHSRMDSAVPADLPADAAEATRDTLGGAVDVAKHLPEQLSGPLLQAAQEAFTEGMRLAAAAGTVLMAVIAVLAAVMLRHLRPDTDDRPAEPVDRQASLRS
ncbi:MFS transporter [Actinoplanes auranticolor]|uniref:MFS transporter n=1 Tax=Actinoplanes auranticolor TaxID=47988 RepID=A0A919S6Q4_9ACTN|nr:MFS transporter [Actinoplanes auranticolor]GIM65922.1 MFS transporter [Actinoplanes auranticolor]